MEDPPYGLLQKAQPASFWCLSPVPEEQLFCVTTVWFSARQPTELENLKYSKPFEGITTPSHLKAVEAGVQEACVVGKQDIPRAPQHVY